MSVAEGEAAPPHERERPLSPAQWFGQPRGLSILFLTDMWEQFSFYGMRAILVFYMTKRLGLAQQNASMIYGLYAASVYFTPILGGVISDRWLGRRASVAIGGGIMAAGHFMMAFPPLFYPALATIAVGNGLFLPSLPSQIDSLYAHDDPRRRSAYNVFYVGINIGAFLAPLVAGTLGETLGFHWGFGAAGIGMLIGLCIYLAGGKYLPADRPRGPAPRGGEAPGGFSRRQLIARFGLLAAIAGCVVVFRGGYEQIGNTVALWSDSGVDRTIVGQWAIPASWFQSLNPLMVFVLTPFYVSRWNRQAAVGREPSSVVKMCQGAAVVGLSFLLMAAAAAWAQAHGQRTSGLWLAALLVLLTAGELLILPVGLGLFGRLAPQGLSATTIALWFLAGFFGNLLAGWLAGYWSAMSHAGFFTLAAGVIFLAAGLLWLLAGRARRMEASA